MTSANQDVQPKLRITATDSSTVFTGAANLHRFDTPSEHDIAVYVRNVLGPNPGGVRVHIAASGERLRRLEAAFGDYDITLTTEELPVSSLLAQDEDEWSDTWDEPTPWPGDEDYAGDNAGDETESWEAGQVRTPEPYYQSAYTTGWEYGEHPPHPPHPPQPPYGALARPEARSQAGAIAVIIGIVAALTVTIGVVVALVLHQRSGSGADSQAQPGGAPESAVGDQQEVLAEPPEPAPELDPGTAPEAPQTVILEQSGVRVELPAGFTIAQDGDTWRATGLDPDFRLHIAVDELYNLPPQTMAEQVLRDVESDPETELVDTDGHSLTYREYPGDGSEVLWKTWPHDNYQIFVACHTRTAPTTVQAATCRMAMDSAEFSPLTGGNS